jgi:peptide-methionine (R)-S-oxide reductase
MYKSNEEWKKELSEDVYKVTREKGTEAPFTGKYNDHKGEGVYKCSNCGTELFSSDNKFDSGSGWPSFDDPVAKENIELVSDSSVGMERTEVICKKCRAHLGHVFEDGPKETSGKRYCINSCSLDFKDNIKI